MDRSSTAILNLWLRLPRSFENKWQDEKHFDCCIPARVKRGARTAPSIHPYETIYFLRGYEHGALVRIVCLSNLRGILIYRGKRCITELQCLHVLSATFDRTTKVDSVFFSVIQASRSRSITNQQAVAQLSRLSMVFSKDKVYPVHAVKFFVYGRGFFSE